MQLIFPFNFPNFPKVQNAALMVYQVQSEPSAHQELSPAYLMPFDGCLLQLHLACFTFRQLGGAVASKRDP